MEPSPSLMPENAEALIAAGLPPTESVAVPADDDAPPAPAPAEPPAPKPPAPAPEPPPEGMAGEDVLTLLKSIDEKLTVPEPAPEPAKPAPPPEVPPDIKAMLEHDDPAVRNFAQAEWARRQEAIQREADLAQRVERIEQRSETAAAQKEIDAATDAYKLSEQQVDAVLNLFEQDPVLASRLTFDAGVRLLFPESVVRTKGGAPPPAEPKPEPGAGQPREQVIVAGGAAGAAPKPWKPGPSETIESAVAAGARKLLGTD